MEVLKENALKIAVLNWSEPLAGWRACLPCEEKSSRFQWSEACLLPQESLAAKNAQIAENVTWCRLHSVTKPIEFRRLNIKSQSLRSFSCIKDQEFVIEKPEFVQFELEYSVFRLACRQRAFEKTSPKSSNFVKGIMLLVE